MAFAIKAEVRDPRAKTFAFAAQKTMDGMTADFYPFDMKFIGQVAIRISTIPALRPHPLSERGKGRRGWRRG